MTKQLTLILFLNCLASSYCLAQGQDEVTERNDVKEEKPSTPSVDKRSSKPISYDRAIHVYFYTNENCLLQVDGKDQGRMFKDQRKTVKLKEGIYKLTFKSEAKGTTLDATFNLKRNMAKKGTYTYEVAFPDPTTGSAGSTKPAIVSAGISKEPELSAELATINELSNNMVLIPGGSFIMGVKGGKVKGLLPHTVTINPVKFGMYEVTRKQWETIMGTAYKSNNKACSNCPIENVSWKEVDSFIRKINTIGKIRFRLPTEAEWEYVAKKALENEINSSNKGSEKKIEDVLEQTAWYNKNSEGKPHPVGSKNPLSGIYDLLGNVAEWCLDYYRSDYQKDTGNNPYGPTVGTGKIVKGGSYLDTDDLKPVVRNKESPLTKKNTIGFRLVMEAK